MHLHFTPHNNSINLYSLLFTVEGEDYEFSGHSQTYYYFNITSNSMTMTPVCAELRILNDRVIEYTESFSVSVHISDATFTLVGSDTSTVQITSDDSKY